MGRGKPFVPVDCGALSEHLAAGSLFGHEKGAYTGADQRLLPATTPAVSAAAPSPSLRGKVTGARAAIEREEIEGALRATGGNIAKSARMLKMDRATLYRKMKTYGVSRPAT